MKLLKYMYINKASMGGRLGSQLFSGNINTDMWREFSGIYKDTRYLIRSKLRILLYCIIFLK